MRLILPVALIAVLAFLVIGLTDMSALAQWAAQKQRAFQNAMAAAVRGLQSGETGAWTGLLTAAAAYGFVHAVGPGHGKYVIGGVGVGSTVPALRLTVIALLSSLAQSLWAIVLVYGSFSLLTYSAHELTALAEDILAPASYLAVAAVGAVLLWRGLRAFLPAWRAMHAPAEHTTDTHCGCAGHGPAPEDVANVHSLRDSVLLIASVAVRPCTGAIFLLIIAWHMDIRFAGVVAVFVMGLGTAGLTTLVAVSSVAARGLTLASATGRGTAATILSGLQAVSGLVVIWISVLFFSIAVRG